MSRGRKREDSFLEEVVFALDPVEEEGGKNGRNAVLLTRGSERSGCRWSKGCVVHTPGGD